MTAIISPVQLEIIEMIEANPKLQPTTKAQYQKAILNYLATGASPADAVALSAYAAGLPHSSRAFLKAAIKLWGDSISLKAKAGATPENIGAVQATVYRIEALTKTIQVEAVKGEKAHLWLSQSQVRTLLDSCNLSILQGQRDRLLLGLLVGAGLRREELAQLTFEDMVIQPVEGKTRTVLNIEGKGAKNRVIPISDRLDAALRHWGAGLNYTGPVVRAISKGGAIRGNLSAIGIFRIVGKAGATIGLPQLAPHDLRRTYAQLGYEAGVSITQVSKLLGHSTVATTQKYLNLDTDLVTTISDFIPF
jgi:integrase